MTSLICFTTLPEELHILILSFLDHPRLLLTVSAVNVQLHRLVGDDTLWHALFLQYNYEKTLYEEHSSVSFKELFKQRFVLDQNWNHSDAVTNLQSIGTERATPQEARRSIQALVATGGRTPVMAVACAKMPVLVYDLTTTRVTSVLPEEDTRTLALVLDLESEKDEPEDKRRLTKGVSRGWGSRKLRLVTGTQKIKVWTLPHRKGIVPLTMKVGSRIRCMHAVDRTQLLLTGCIHGSVKLWDIDHGKLVRDLDGFHEKVLCLDVYQLRSSPGEEAVFLAGGGSEDCTAKIWNLKTGETTILRGHQQPVHRILIDEDIVVAGSLDSTVRTWRLDTGEPLGLFTSHKTMVTHLSHISICTSPIRSLLTVCHEGIAAIHTLDEEALKDPAISRRPTRLNLSCSTYVDVERSDAYLVVGGKDGVLSLFHLEEQNDAGGEAGSHIAIRPIRTIYTGFSFLCQIYVFKSGIIVGGIWRHAGGGHAGPCFLYYDFAREQKTQ